MSTAGAPIFDAERGRIAMALLGDTMLSRGLRPFREPAYLGLVDLLRSAEVTVANLETTVRHPHEGTANFTQGTPMSTPPALLDDLRWMGVDMVSMANNHATDYGPAGVLASLAHVRQAGLAGAGAGATLMQARRPAYHDCAAGRVALVSATSFFRPWNRAADSRPDAVGRPGISPLGFSTTSTVDAPALEALRRVSDALGMTQERVRQRSQFYSASEAPADDPDSVLLLGRRFRLGDAFANHTRVDGPDAEDVLRWIREARKQADWVVFAFHNHEFGEAGQRTAPTDVALTQVAEFAESFAHAAIDAGAHVVAGHGPHLTLGVEVYRQCPIFYSLGNFVFQNETLDDFPAEAYARFGLDSRATPSEFLDARTGRDTRGFPASAEFWQGCLARCEFDAHRLTAVRLVPLDLGHGRPRAQRGRPVLATGATAQAILDRIEALSQRYGTRLRREGDTGVLLWPGSGA